MDPIFMPFEEFLETIAQRESPFLRRVAFMKEIPAELSAWSIWDRRVIYQLFSNDTKGVVSLNTFKRASNGLDCAPFAARLPGMGDMKIFRRIEDVAKYLEGSKRPLRMAGPIIKTAYGEVPCPSMREYHSLLFEIHIEESARYKVLAVQSYDPFATSLRDQILNTGIGLVRGSAIGKFSDEKEIILPELERKEFDFAQIIEMYQKVDAETINRLTKQCT